MTDLRDTLAAMKERAKEYRLTMDLEVVHDWAGEAVNDDLALVDTVQAVLDLHKPDAVIVTTCAECSDYGSDDHPMGELIPWPCPTVRTITEKLEGLT